MITGTRLGDRRRGRCSRRGMRRGHPSGEGADSSGHARGTGQRNQQEEEEEVVMTDPHETQRDRKTEATADPKPEVKPELIKDLDVTGEDAENIAGGQSRDTRA